MMTNKAYDILKWIGYSCRLPGDKCTLSNDLAFLSRLSKNPSVYKVGFGGNPARWFDDSSRIYHESVLLISNGLGWQPRSYMYGFCI